MYLHADNCTGQNKNNSMLHYLAWCVMTGLHRHITLSFLIIGHTKFAPDWCFGLLEKKYRLTKVGTLADIEKVVNDSATVNIPQLCGTEDGEIIVPTYDWKGEFTLRFKNTPHLKTYHHFRFTHNSPGSVFVKKNADTVEPEIVLLRNPSWQPITSELTPLISPQGLPPERKWYLYEHIREFCPDYAKGSVAPLPQVAKPGSSWSQNATNSPPASNRTKCTC